MGLLELDVEMTWALPRLRRKRKNSRTRIARRPRRLPITIPATAPLDRRDALPATALLVGVSIYVGAKKTETHLLTDDGLAMPVEVASAVEPMLVA